MSMHHLFAFLEAELLTVDPNQSTEQKGSLHE